MARRSCDGAGLLAAFESAVANLAAHVDEINALNVYPVPDGDTGANMVATVNAALAEARRAASEPATGALPTEPGATTVERIATAISFGALMGARGNSGVITSQIVRGMAEALAGKRRFNALDLANALDQGARRAYGAVARPVEGTILTVIREAADEAVAAAERENDLEAVASATVAAAERAVARTPSLLPILLESGVVDAGGQGLVRLFEGALAYLHGTAGAVAPRPADVPAPSTLVPHADTGFGYETMFLVQAHSGHSLDLDAIRTRLEAIGDSVLVAGDPRAAKVHVHSPRPDEVLAFGFELGLVSRINVENLDDQARDVRERRARAFAADGGPADLEAGSATARPDAAPTGPPALARANGAAPTGSRLPLAVLAVAPGDGFAAAFEAFGALTVRGGQADNPSVGELTAAVERANAADVLLLPNNPNVLLAARHVAELSNATGVHVVPTRNAAEGLAAVIELDPARDAVANARAMAEAAHGLRTLQVTEAVRDATIGGRKVKHGQTIVLDPDEGLVASDGDRNRALVSAIRSLPAGFELLTLYYGDGADLAEAEATGRLLGSTLGGVEVEVVHGGQAHYRYLIAAE